MKEIRVGTRVRVRLGLARAWGLNTSQRQGIVVGKDPAGRRRDVVACRLDCGFSLFEFKGINVGQLLPLVAKRRTRAPAKAGRA